MVDLEECQHAETQLRLDRSPFPQGRGMLGSRFAANPTYLGCRRSAFGDRDCQAAAGGFFVLGEHVAAGLAHCADHAVE